MQIAFLKTFYEVIPLPRSRHQRRKIVNLHSCLWALLKQQLVVYEVNILPHSCDLVLIDDFFEAYSTYQILNVGCDTNLHV